MWPIIEFISMINSFVPRQFYDTSHNVYKHFFHINYYIKSTSIPIDTIETVQVSCNISDFIYKEIFYTCWQTSHNVSYEVAKLAQYYKQK